jgi:hypothetical protein
MFELFGVNRQFFQFFLEPGSFVCFARDLANIFEAIKRSTRLMHNLLRIITAGVVQDVQHQEHCRTSRWNR